MNPYFEIIDKWQFSAWQELLPWIVMFVIVWLISWGVKYYKKG